MAPALKVSRNSRNRWAKPVFVVLFAVHLVLVTWAAPTRKEVLAAMKTATSFMMNTVSTRGGFVQKYSLDLKERYGELKARDSMIWVEPPSTPTVGLMLIEAHRVTNDPQYLEYADRVAGAARILIAAARRLQDETAADDGGPMPFRTDRIELVVNDRLHAPKTADVERALQAVVEQAARQVFRDARVESSPLADPGRTGVTVRIPDAPPIETLT